MVLDVAARRDDLFGAGPSITKLDFRRFCRYLGRIALTPPSSKMVQPARTAIWSIWEEK
jgi:hypothetical protein